VFLVGLTRVSGIMVPDEATSGIGQAALVTLFLDKLPTAPAPAGLSGVE
jgi:hypothetical protein